MVVVVPGLVPGEVVGSGGDRPARAEGLGTGLVEAEGVVARLGDDECGAAVDPQRVAGVAALVPCIAGVAACVIEPPEPSEWWPVSAVLTLLRPDSSLEADPVKLGPPRSSAKVALLSSN